MHGIYPYLESDRQPLMDDREYDKNGYMCEVYMETTDGLNCYTSVTCNDGKLSLPFFAAETLNPKRQTRIQPGQDDVERLFPGWSAVLQRSSHR